ncbi:PNGase F N-terminal domain-containing protein [uncultured Paraglaciecola sp.]|uniref:PNGase F N-terminal domain-containing protein n=1 Tax=uncultured Paraglaciecola sp. TaxID=1765024 RepID=UPI0026373381|nr:PNGase F N-terminal domain-containing protein [uncultured Paraglaciecola sp.]
MKFIVCLLCCVTLLSCQVKLPSQGNKSLVVFDDTQLYFDMQLKSAPQDGTIIRLDAGRVLLKKVRLPRYAIQPKVKVSMTLKSNGDPWDKSGSLFVIPKSKGANLLDFEQGRFGLKSLNQPYPAVKASATAEFNYLPNVELLRFMTPFGVGFFNQHERTQDRKPPYIPAWKDEVSWTQDISQLLPLLEDEVYIGVYIDTWDNKGYRLSVKLDFNESRYLQQEKRTTKVLPLVNTVKYASDQRLFDGFAQGELTANFELPQGASNAILHYITTGHGGHASGDEFTKKENIISLDSEVLKRFIPWRDDCASFRRFNPSSGTWKAKDVFLDSSSDERIASSDLSRSNWCPGSDVTPQIIELGNIGSGEHQLSIAIPQAQVAKDNEHNYWMVSAYLTYEIN